MDRIKVLLVAPYGSKGVGGIGTWSKIMIDYCGVRDEVNLHFQNTAQGLPKRQALGNKITHLLIGGLDSFLIIVKVFWNMLVFRPDVVHYTSSAATALYKDKVVIWIVKSIFNKKFVIHWHFGRIPSIFQEKGKEYSRFLTVCQRSDISIAIDEKSYRTLQAAGINSVYIPNPISLSLQQQSEVLDLALTNEKRVEGVVLFVGYLLQSKGVLELVEACADIDEVKQLVLVGPLFEDTMRGIIEAKASIRDNGRWLQFIGEIQREEVWNYYKKCCLFCLPSYSEGFPNVILESMAFGCPIVATDVGAIPEMLEDECGVIVEAKKVEPLKKAIRELLFNQSMARSLGIKAHEKVLANYTIDKLYNKYYDVWNNSIR